MSAQIVFLTLFLGIVSGSHPVSLQVSGPVKTVRMMLGTRQVAVLTQPPWRATIDFERELAPRELTAVGFDENGREIARATQVLNLPRPIAEFDIALERDGSAPPTGAVLRWRHLMNVPPKSAKMSLDGKPIALDKTLHAKLPKLDLETPHVLAAELLFGDGFLARRELVIESVRSDSVGTELTPIAVRETAAQHPASWDGCLVNPGGRAVRTAAIEKPRALLIVVRDVDERAVREVLDVAARAPAARGESLRHYLSLDKGTVMRMLWPVGARFENPENATSLLFVPSQDFDATDTGMMRFLTVGGPLPEEESSPRFADAVAVAGVRAVTGSQRRAVVYMLSRTSDASRNDPAAVRRYLVSLGVPLFVWSIAGPRSDVAATWGPVEDVSSLPKLGAAVNRVRRTLEEQRIAWVDVDPLTALRLKANASCGIEMLTVDR
jgi:hypothetical protein